MDESHLEKSAHFKVPVRPGVGLPDHVVDQATPFPGREVERALVREHSPLPNGRSPKAQTAHPRPAPPLSQLVLALAVVQLILTLTRRRLTTSFAARAGGRLQGRLPFGVEVVGWEKFGKCAL